MTVHAGFDLNQAEFIAPAGRNCILFTYTFSFLIIISKHE